MFHNILEPEFDGIGFKSNEDFKIMRPQHLAVNAVVRWGGEGQTCLLVCTNCSVWMAINYMRVSSRNCLFLAKTKITLDSHWLQKEYYFLFVVTIWLI